MILGDWDQEYGSGRATYEATCRLALDLGVMADLLTPGNIHPVDPYFSAFDVFLNTSVYEGLPIALLEAAQAGCPIVAADVGGVREALPIGATLVSDASDIAAYADGVLSAARRRVRDVRSPPADPDLIPRLWPLLAEYGGDGLRGEMGAAGGTLFLTHGLHVGGPARALTNLLTRLPPEMKTALCAVEGGSVGSLRRAIEAAQVPILDLADAGSLTDKAEQILAWMRQLNLGTLCFWNTPPELKLLLSKVLSASSMRLVDVSPGPMLFDELEASADFQRRIAWDGNAYLSRLDDFVALYAGGAPKGEAQPRRVSVIPRGVLEVPRFVPLPPADAMLAEPFDPALAIGTCCRVVPDKRIDFLIDMMAEVNARAPGASLTIVGGPDANSLDYWERLKARVEREHLAYIRFVGPHEDVNPFLAQLQVFVMVSNRQGCPNASLEAMAMGLPVIANPDGGTAEQVVDGVTGFLVEAPAAMATRVVELLGDPGKRRRFGTAGRARALELFSLEAMVERYASLLGA
jgi:glycosyltransferase involved in cell wall biosynthesis